MLLVFGLVSIAAMAVVGWVIGFASNGEGPHRFAATVINDRDTSVTIQPCARFFCSKFRSVDLAPGAAYTWETSDGDGSVQSFVIEVTPGGRILGCAAQHGLRPAGGSAIVRVSGLEKCVT